MPEDSSGAWFVEISYTYLTLSKDATEIEKMHQNNSLLSQQYWPAQHCLQHHLSFCCKSFRNPPDWHLNSVGLIPAIKELCPTPSSFQERICDKHHSGTYLLFRFLREECHSHFSAVLITFKFSILVLQQRPSNK